MSYQNEAHGDEDILRYYQKQKEIEFEEEHADDYKYTDEWINRTLIYEMSES